MDTSQLQEAHYNDISSEYTAHYGDESSSVYAENFFCEPMFRGIDLRGKNVLEAMCGSGGITSHLTRKGASVTGLDIASKAIDRFRVKWPECRAVCASIFESGLPSESFDIIAVVGGLHHVQPNVSLAVDKIHALLKPGGVFCFVEPHASSFPDHVRKRWYQHDHYFESNEMAIDINSLHKKFTEKFERISEIYQGNIAYLLVFNSLIFRIPVFLKKVYAPIFFFLERLIGPLQNKYLSCYVVAQWRKLA